MFSIGDDGQTLSQNIFDYVQFIIFLDIESIVEKSFQDKLFECFEYLVQAINIRPG
jgi:hypothetical protein